MSDPELLKSVDVTIRVPGFVAAHLKMWEDSGVPAPLNELQSIAAWLRYLGQNGADETKKAMRNRILILMKAANNIYEAGPYVEELAEIYKNRPDRKPDTDQRDGNQEAKAT